MTPTEAFCIGNCADVFQKTNMRLMQQFMKLSPDMVKKREQEMKEKFEKNFPDYNKEAAEDLTRSDEPIVNTDQLQESVDQPKNIVEVDEAS